MRPLELRIRDFRSYFGEEQIFDFRGRGLVGIVGPIGSGKSSILDAISFALYGKTPTVAAGTKALIHQRADGGSVVLRFEVDGEIWEAVRALRRKGQSQHALYRLAGDEPDPERLEKLVLEAEVNAKVVELLGLEFDAFTRSVLLAQGRFAQFLAAQPAERDGVLKGVFGHERIDRMRATAKDRAANLEAEVGRLDAVLSQLDVVAAKRADHATERSGLEEKLERLAKAEPAIRDLDETIAAATRERQIAHTRLDELKEHEHRLPDRDEAAAAVAEAKSSRGARDELGTALEAALEAAVTAEQDLEAAAPDRGVVADATSAFGRRGPQAARVEELEGRLAALEKSLLDAEKNGERAADEVKTTADRLVVLNDAARDAGERFSDLEAKLFDARHEDMASALRSGLHRGDTCPVCLQVVDDVPAPAMSDLAGLEAEVAAARERQEQAVAGAGDAAVAAEVAEAAEASARKSVESLREELDASQKLVAAAVAELAETDGHLEALLGSGDPETLIEERRSALEELSTAATRARRTADRARTKHDEAIRAAQEFDRTLGELKIQIGEAAGRVGVDVDLSGDSPDSIIEILAGLTEAWEATFTEMVERRAAAEKALEAANESRQDLLTDLGVEDDLAAAIADVGARVEILTREIEAADTQLADGAGMGEERIEIENRRILFKRLASDLTDAKFIRYLLDEERRRLADLGSDHFQALTSGRYRFSDDGKFDVVDLTAADALRKSGSLSGGETFLASLALALALAEMVSRTGSRLDAFFLDEGFGTLDPEHLDLAMEGVESLAASGPQRLVVVVSHVPELRHRLEDLIQLDRNPVTGDTRVVRA